MINESHRNARPCACRGGGCGNGGGCRKIMDQLRAVEFAITETVLYLKLVTERDRLVGAYESQCGPLTMYGNAKNGWEWTEGPWPWEAEANG